MKPISTKDLPISPDLEAKLKLIEQKIDRHPLSIIMLINVLFAAIGICFLLFDRLAVGIMWWLVGIFSSYVSYKISDSCANVSDSCAWPTQLRLIFEWTLIEESRKTTEEIKATVKKLDDLIKKMDDTVDRIEESTDRTEISAIKIDEVEQLTFDTLMQVFNLQDKLQTSEEREEVRKEFERFNRRLRAYIQNMKENTFD